MKVLDLIRQAAAQALRQPRLFVPLMASTAASYVVGVACILLRPSIMRMFATHSVLGGEYPATQLSAGLVTTSAVLTWLPPLANVCAVVLALGIVSRNWRFAPGETLSWSWPHRLGSALLPISGACAAFLLLSVFAVTTLLRHHIVDSKAAICVAFSLFSYPLAILVAPVLRRYVVDNGPPLAPLQPAPQLSTFFWITGHAFLLQALLGCLLSPLNYMHYREPLFGFTVGLVLTWAAAAPLQLGIFALCAASQVGVAGL